MSFRISLKKTRITVNGQSYSSPDEMPPDIRAQYEKAMSMLDRNQNGIPDALEQTSSSSPIPGVHITTSTTQRIVVNGQEYNSLDEVPEQFRHTIEQAFQSAAPKALQKHTTPVPKNLAFDDTPRQPKPIPWFTILAIAAALVIVGGYLANLLHK
jgi:hypothetical protein